MDERKSARHIVDMPIKCSLEGVELNAFLYDLSTTGCLIEVDADNIAADMPIEICLGDHGRHEGQIIWRRSICTGIRFECELHARIVSALGYSEPEYDIECAVPKDRFGRTLPPLAA